MNKLKLLGGAMLIASLTAGTAYAEPLKVGILESLSGGQTSTGRPFATAAGFGIDLINQTGGFNGAKIEIL